MYTCQRRYTQIHVGTRSLVLYIYITPVIKLIQAFPAFFIVVWHTHLAALSSGNNLPTCLPPYDVDQSTCSAGLTPALPPLPSYQSVHFTSKYPLSNSSKQLNTFPRVFPIMTVMAHFITISCIS